MRFFAKTALGVNLDALLVKLEVNSCMMLHDVVPAGVPLEFHVGDTLGVPAEVPL